MRMVRVSDDFFVVLSDSNVLKATIYKHVDIKAESFVLSVMYKGELLVHSSIGSPIHALNNFDMNGELKL